MARSLVIVESPAKSKTIEKFLGKDYKVLASYGHVRALPSKQGSVDVEAGFVPKYQVLPESKKHIEQLAKEVANCEELILATDLDREGEAIAWHLLQALHVAEKGKKPVVKRVTFHEITKPAILKAMAKPHKISHNLVDAQQARAILDYLVGFTLSPFLWKKIRYGLSAGRVQSVALRLICEREQEIGSFKSKEYWSLETQLESSQKKSFPARLNAVDGNTLKKYDIPDQDSAEALVAGLQNRSFRVAAIECKEKKRSPAPPFTTSTLQQEASRKLGFSARKTMTVAQKLYEGIDIGQGAVGLITYMRTDSVALSELATTEAREEITRLYGEEYALPKPRVFKSKAKNAQEAHEAIRPTSIANHPDQIKGALSSDQYKLYRLIWLRTVASQMALARLDATTVDIETQPGEGDGKVYSLRATGQVVRFPGFMKLYIEGTDDENVEEPEGMLPPLQEQEAVNCLELLPNQHFTQPPPRYTEASLVKTMEEYGIGRPSTYASIMNTLVTRRYVRLEKRTFFAEDIGFVVSNLLSNHFTQYVDYDFTAKFEEQLDAVSRGEKQWKPLLKEYWEPFMALLRQKDAEIAKGELTTEETDKQCPECGKPLVIKLGRSGKFLACSGFPDCRHTEPLEGAEKEEPEVSDQKCDKCEAPMLVKMGRYGKFLACSAYPDCKNIQPLVKPKALGVACPDCDDGELMEKKSRYGKIFYSCNRYPKCKFALWDKPLEQPCPKCGFPLTVEKVTKRYGTVHKCVQEGCDWQEVIVPPEKKASSRDAEEPKQEAAPKGANKKAPARKAATKKTTTKKAASKKED
ncbi:MAG: type I DNA topoisomerase [Desulfuromonadaceae bacterium]|nr:type I DNA topoisomerase [Desulfuromonadaceae bacterium]